MCLHGGKEVSKGLVAFLIFNKVKLEKKKNKKKKKQTFRKPRTNIDYLKLLVLFNSGHACLQSMNPVIVSNIHMRTIHWTLYTVMNK